MEEEIDELFDRSGIGDTDFCEMFSEMLNGALPSPYETKDFDKGEK